MRPSPQEVEDLFEVVCIPSRSGPNFYSFSDNAAVHSKDECLRIIEVCMILDTRPTDLVTSEMFHAIVTRLAAVEEALDTLRPVVGELVEDA